MLRTWGTTTHIAAVRDGQTQGGPRKRRLNVSMHYKLQSRVKETLMHPGKQCTRDQEKFRCLSNNSINYSVLEMGH